MPNRFSTGSKIRSSQRFNPLNSSPSIARAHVYSKPVVIHEPASRGVGRTYRSKRDAEDI